jgi:hypothetical protein
MTTDDDAQTGHVPAPESTQTGAEGSQAPVDLMGSEAARVARYADSRRLTIEQAAYVMCDNSMDIADRGGIPKDCWDSAIEDSAALADHGMLRWMVENPVTGAPEFADAVADEEHAGLVARAEAAEAKVAKVEPLLHDGEGHLPSGLTVDLLGIAVDMEQEGRPLFAKWLRLLSAAALADAPAEQAASRARADENNPIHKSPDTFIDVDMTGLNGDAL